MHAAVLTSAVLIVGVSPAVAAPADPDVSFGTSGFVIGNVSDRSGSASIQGLARQPDGKIVAAGLSHNNTSQDFALARLNTHGSLHPALRNLGVVVTGMGGGDEFGRAVALQADGKIVVAGYVQQEFARFALARYLPDGTLDATFGNGGRVLTSIGESNPFGLKDAFAWALVIQPDGKILVGGFSFQ